jgi:hypothetical protein
VLPNGIQVPSGGGSGGSLKVIADGNFTNNGIIDVNGGKGGNGNEKSNLTGGGGGGGRVAIFHKGAYSNTGTIVADGGEKGYIIGGNPTFNNGQSLAQSGKNGTVNHFDLSTSPRKAADPAPRNGDKMVYAPVPDTNLILKWYSGYNATEANDIVYFKEGSPPNDGNKIGLPVPATRGQHSSTEDVNITAGPTYYWKVRTVPADGNISAVDSNVWSFQTVSWQCQEPNDSNEEGLDGIAGWPEWDTYPHDCVMNDADLQYFAEYWRINRGGGMTGSTPLFDEYTVNFKKLYKYIRDWMGCRGRTNNGCNGWMLIPEIADPNLSKS